MPIRLDIAVLSQRGEPVLEVEIRNRSDTSTAWAMQLRQNLLAHGGGVGTPFFMVVTPDRAFVWTQHSPADVEAPPDFEFDTAKILEGFVDINGTSFETISESVLSILVTFWLDQLLQTDAEKLSPENRWLVDSGLLAAVRHGHIEQEALV